MQYHFIVYYDTETGKYGTDYDTQDALFDGKPVYSPTLSKWFDIFEEDMLVEQSEYNRIADALEKVLENLAPEEVAD